MANIKFGTSGWRAIISDEFTFDNVRLVTQAIANFLKTDYRLQITEYSLKVIVGYDTRFLSKEFAKAAAEVLAGNKIKVLLCDRDTPTPVISYHIIKERLAGAINFTASHNPAEYNGMKFSPETGAPAPTEVTDKIEEEIKKLQEVSKNVGVRFIEPLGLDKSSPYITINVAPNYIKIFNPKIEYFSRIKRIVNFNVIKKAKLKIAVDCLYGTSRDYLDVLLKQANCKIEVLHNWLNPSFDGKRPEPAEENIKELIECVKKNRLDLGLSCDGDADRFGIVDSDGAVITANQVISLLLYHLIKTRPLKKNSVVVRTVATTHMLDGICKKYRVKAIETPVGFKYFVQYLTKANCIIAGEESGGLSISGHIPEKDGILACLLITEMVAMNRKPLRELLRQLYKEIGHFYFKRIDLHIAQPANNRSRHLPESIAGRVDKEKKDKMLKEFINNPPKIFANQPVVYVNKADGCKLLFTDSSWALFRPSGTEPIIRCYFEARTESRLRQLIAAGRMQLSTIVAEP